MFFIALERNIMADRHWSECHNDSVTYGIDWDTGLSWARFKGGGAPIYASSFTASFHNVKQLDKKD